MGLTKGGDEREFRRESIPLLQAPVLKEDVLSWFLEDRRGDDSAWVISKLRQQRPELLGESDRSGLPGCFRHPRQPRQRGGGHTRRTVEDTVSADNAATPRLDHQLTPEEGDSTTQGVGIAIVQFAADTFFAEESDGSLILDLLRIGALEGTSSVRYFTKDVSGQAGIHYEEAKGTVTFAPGEMEAQIRVNILDNADWNNTIEFEVVLEAVSSGVQLGAYMRYARVKVLNDDTFPSNRCKYAVEQHTLNELPEFTLFREFVKLCLSDHLIRRGSIKMVIVDQLHNVFMAMKLLVNCYVVESIFKRADEEDRDLLHTRLIVCALLITLPVLLLHFLDHRKFFWRVSGRVRGILLTGLFRTYLNLSAPSRARVQPGSVIMAATRDVQSMVTNGYMSVLTLLKCFGNVVTMFLAKVLVNKSHQVALSIYSALPLLSFPIIFTLFLICRRRRLIEYLILQDETEDQYANHIVASVDQSRIMRDYLARSFNAKQYDGLVAAYNSATTDVMQVTMNTTYFVTWTVTLVTALYMVFRGAEVVAGECKLGIYLMDIQIFLGMGNIFGTIFNVVLKITSARPCLQRVTSLMNMPQDLVNEMHISRMKSRCSRAEFKQLPDEMCIVLNNINYEHVGDVISKGPVDLKGYVEVKQGSLVALVGPPAEGKTTVLRLLAGILGHQGRHSGAFVPSHLRVLHVPVTPLFVYGTLYENLIYGIRQRPDDAKLTRVKEVCRLLYVDQRIIDLLESGECLKWGEIFSRSQVILLNLARALVFNPEMLCLQMPLCNLHPFLLKNTVKILRDFVRKRGIACDPDTFHLRRPRTCFFTSHDEAGALYADRIVHISMDGVQTETNVRDMRSTTSC